MLVVLLAVAGPAARAMAQIGELPTEIISAPTLSPEQTSIIERYVKQQVDELESGEAARLKRARQNLEAPASHAGATISFRAAYSDVLVPHLDRLARLENEVVVINAVQIAGTLATQASVGLAERFRADSRPAVRLKAVAALGQTFRAIERAAPVVAQEEALQIVANLASGLDGEADPSVTDAYVRALISASRMQADSFRSVPDAALEALIRATSSRVRRLGNTPADHGVLQACIRGADEVSKVLAADFLQKRRPESLVRAAAGLGGDLLALVFRRVRGGALPLAQDGNIEAAQAGRTVEFTVTQLGVTIVYSARDRLAQGSVDRAPDLAGMIQQANAGGDREFVRNVGAVIGEGGLLTREPFNFSSDRFQGR